MDLDPRIFYILPIPLQEIETGRDLTPFQGFQSALVHINPFLESVLYLPQDILQLYQPIEATCVLRMTGRSFYNFVIIEQECLLHMTEFPLSPFLVVLSDDVTRDSAADFSSKCPYPVLHGSTRRKGNILSIEQMDRRRMYKWVKRVIDSLISAGKLTPKARYFFDRKMSQLVDRQVSIATRGHNCTAPNETVLASLGYRHLRNDPLMPDPDSDGSHYFQAIADSVKTLFNERERLMQKAGIDGIETPFDVIVASPECYRHINRAKTNPSAATVKFGEYSGPQKLDIVYR